MQLHRSLFVIVCDTGRRVFTGAHTVAVERLERTLGRFGG